MLEHKRAQASPPANQHLTSAYVRSIRYHTSAYVSIRQILSAYVSIRQHTSAVYVSIRQHTQEKMLEHTLRSFLTHQIYLFMYPYLSIYLCMYPYLSIYLSIYIYIYLSIYLYTCIHTYIYHLYLLVSKNAERALKLQKKGVTSAMNQFFE